MLEMNEFKGNFANKKVLITLTFILILGALLRFYGLANQSLWNDELSTWGQSHSDDLSEVITRGVQPSVHPPGYQILIYFIEKYIGESEHVLRFPSVVSGILSIFAIFLLGVQLYTYKEGLIASAFMATFHCPIFFSQEARSYSMLLLFTMLATYFWIAILRSLNEKGSVSSKMLSGYIINAIISSYLHYFGLYLVILQGLGAVVFSIHCRRRLTCILLIYFGIFLAYIPWLPTMWEHLNKGPTWILAPSGIIRTFMSYLDFLFNRKGMLVSLALTMYTFLFCHSVYKVLKYRGEYRGIKSWILSPSSLLVLWLVIPFAGAYIKSISSAPVLTFRNLIISLPAAYLLLARSITQLPIRSRNQAVITSSIIGLFLFNLLFHREYYSKPHKEQFREAVNYIVDHDSRYRNSFIVGHAHNKNYFDYYFKKSGSSRRVDLKAGKEKDIRSVAKAVKKRKPKYIWYISAHLNPDEKFIDFLNERFISIKHKNFVKANVRLYKNNKKI